MLGFRKGFFNLTKMTHIVWRLANVACTHKIALSTKVKYINSNKKQRNYTRRFSMCNMVMQSCLVLKYLIGEFPPCGHNIHRKITLKYILIY